MDKDRRSTSEEKEHVKKDDGTRREPSRGSDRRRPPGRDETRSETSVDENRRN